MQSYLLWIGGWIYTLLLVLSCLLIVYTDEPDLTEQQVIALVLILIHLFLGTIDLWTRYEFKLRKIDKDDDNIQSFVYVVLLGIVAWIASVFANASIKHLSWISFLIFVYSIAFPCIMCFCSICYVLFNDCSNVQLFGSRTGKQVTMIQPVNAVHHAQHYGSTCCV